jgi:hypothetical protein
MRKGNERNERTEVKGMGRRGVRRSTSDVLYFARRRWA